MADLKLDLDEGILITAYQVGCIGNENRERIAEMHLTNKNIVYVTSHSEKTGGVFSKPVIIEEVQKVPLSSIKVINGKVMATREELDPFTFALQIQFVSGVEKYFFDDDEEIISAKWANEINRLLGKEPPYQEETSQEQEAQKEDDFLGLSGLAASFKEMAGSFRESVSSKAKTAADSKKKNNAEKQAEKAASKQAVQIPAQSQPNQQLPEGGFCINCGTQLPPGTRFCPRCGTPVNGSAGQTPPPPPQIQPVQANPAMQPAQPQGYPQMQPNQPYPQMPPIQGNPQMQQIPTNTYGNSETRRQEFAGKVVKCPNCGELIGYEDVVCPSCGMELSGRSGSSSVQRLQDQLLAIEDSRTKRTALGNLMAKDLDDESIVRKKVTVIKNFPIPNTIEEIAEFTMLAAGNINVKLSKVSLASKIGRPGGLIGLTVKMIELPVKVIGVPGQGNNSKNRSKEYESSISDAWVVKLQQAYQKAKFSFSDRPIFKKIKQIYTDKMKELNLKVEK